VKKFDAERSGECGFRVTDRVTFTEMALRDAGMFAPAGWRYRGTIVALSAAGDVAAVRWSYDNTCKTFRRAVGAGGAQECCVVCWRPRASGVARCGQLSDVLETLTSVRMLKLA